MNESNHKTGPPRALWFSVVGALVLLAMLLYACAPVATPEPTPTPIPPTATPIPIPDQSAQLAEWEEGPMSAAYDIGKGPNTMCTRCHSPQNWLPGSKVGPNSAPGMANCVTCKFPNQPMFPDMIVAPTFAEGGMDLVTEEQWVGIPCAQCHEVDANGTASAELAWLAPIALTYEKINTPDELCTKCHASPAGTKSGSQGLAASRLITVGGSAHLNYAGEWPQADRPQYCTDCHIKHSSQTKQCVDCHTDTTATHTRVAPMMETVTCMGCHDASGATVGIAQEGGLFTTILVTPPGPRGPGSSKEIVSHSIVYLVSCNRCHKEGNTYGLTVLKADGTVPPPPTPAPIPTP